MLFLFVLFNENNNMCGTYEFNDQEAMLWTGLNTTELEEAKKRFTREKKFIFNGGWVKVLNHNKYNCYGRGEKQEAALKKELSLIPPFIKEIDTSMDTSINTLSIPPIIHKSKNINQKSEKEEDKKFDFGKVALQTSVPISCVKDTYERLLDWEKMKGTFYKDKEAAVRNWIRRDKKEGKIAAVKKPITLLNSKGGGNL